VRPCEACIPAERAETQGIAQLCQQMHEESNNLLKEEVESSTRYLLPRAAPMQALGTPPG